MVGYPKHLNTKEDYLFVKDNFPKSMWKEDFQKLLDTSKDWFFEKELASKEEGLEDETHKIEINEERDNDIVTKTTYYQFVYKVHPNSKLLSLGFTEEEVLSYIK